MPNYPTDNLKDISGNAVAVTNKALDNVAEHMEQKDTGNTVKPAEGTTTFNEWGDTFTSVTNTVQDLANQTDAVTITMTPAAGNSALVQLLAEVKSLYASIGVGSYALTGNTLANNFVGYSEAWFPFENGDIIKIDGAINTGGGNIAANTEYKIAEIDVDNKKFKFANKTTGAIMPIAAGVAINANVYMSVPTTAESMHLADLEGLKYNGLMIDAQSLAFKLRRFAKIVRNVNGKATALPKYAGNNTNPTDKAVFTA